MSAYKFVTLTCDICGEIYDPGTARTVREARAAARADGWKTLPGSRDECLVHHGWRRTMSGGYERVREEEQ